MQMNFSDLLCFGTLPWKPCHEILPLPLSFQIPHQLVRLRKNITVIPESLAPCIVAL